MAELPSSVCKTLRARPWLTYDRNANALFDGVKLSDVAHQFGTPCWVTSASVLRSRAKSLKAAFVKTRLKVDMHFAVKANDHQAILTVLLQEGFGADVVSGGELRRAQLAGIAAKDIVYSGVGKTDDELRAAISADIGSINVESREELERLTELACASNARPRITLRVNPHIDAQTHEKISTGRAGDKFGIDWTLVPALYRQAARHPNLDVIGLAAHIGSQITTLAPFEAACQRLAVMVRDLRADGLHVQHVDCGGGLGICYNEETSPDVNAYARLIEAQLGKLDVSISIEPGRWVSGPAGLLLTRVIDTKAQGPVSSDFVILDAAMNDLARPALYQAWHDILPLSLRQDMTEGRSQTFVGPVCETGDILAQDRVVPPVARGDVLAILDTGAYGSVMSSAYNSRPLAAHIMLEAGQVAEIQARQPVEALWVQERVPDWLKAE